LIFALAVTTLVSVSCPKLLAPTTSTRASPGAKTPATFRIVISALLQLDRRAAKRARREGIRLRGDSFPSSMGYHRRGLVRGRAEWSHDPTTAAVPGDSRVALV